MSSCWSPFGKDKIPSRWAIMTSCLLYMCLAGTVYAFGLISDTIKSRLSLSQSQLDIIGTMGRFGASSTIIPGIFNNYYGPSISVWFGLFFITLGWLLLTIFTSEIIDISSLSYSYIIIGISNFIYLHGNVWFSGIAAPTIVQNFPVKDHGKLLGLAKGYLGLGSAYVAIWKTDLADGNVDAFMFAYLIFLPTFSFIFGWFLIQIPSKRIVRSYIIKNELNKNNVANFKPWYLAAVICAIYLGIVSIIQDIYHVPIYIKIIIFILSQMIWLSPWILAIFLHGPFWLRINTSLDDNSLIVPSLLSSKGNKCDPDKSMIGAAVVDPVNAKLENNIEIRSEALVADVGMPQIFLTIEFWLLYIPFIIVSGSGLIFISNVAQIIESVSSTSTKDDTNANVATSLVTIISVGNFFGRITVGYLSDNFGKKYHRVFWMIFSCIGMIISTLFVYFIGDSPIKIELFFIVSCCIGFSYGWIFSVVISSCSDLWGTKYLSGNYASLDSAPAIGQLLMSNLIFARLYDSQGHSEHDGNKCYGDECYKNSFLIAAFANVAALMMSLILWKITKRRSFHHN